MKTLIVLCGQLLLCGAAAAMVPQSDAKAEVSKFDAAATGIQRQLAESIAELNQLRDNMAAEQIPLSRRLHELENELTAARQEFQDTSRTLDKSTLELSNLGTEIKRSSDEVTYLSNLLGEYTRGFESRLHITELRRYEDTLNAAKLAPENKTLSTGEVYAAQMGLVTTALERLHEVLGGARFDATAVDTNGIVRTGQVVLVGPAALFRSSDGLAVGTAEQRLGSLEPTIMSFSTPELASAAGQLVSDGRGVLPLDPTLGDAHQIAATEETLLEHIKKGGPVMYPILGMAGAALLVALYKWISFLALRKPSRKDVDALIDCVARRDFEGAQQRAAQMRGPLGKMLAAGVAHLREPRQLVEEIMYEIVLTTRLRLQRMLPFVAICAASAPLLGLLGTVTGIINTFKLITIFGSGDVKTLSSGISEALITTEFGLIVSIPSLLLHSFLSRKATGVVQEMETTAIAMVNHIATSPSPEVLVPAPAKSSAKTGTPVKV